MREKYFDIKRDKQFPYFCHACLIGKSEMSQDNRYCPSCYDFLLKEVELDTSWRTPAWKPILHSTASKSEGIETAGVSQGIRTIMATVNGGKSEVAKIEARIPQRTETRGRKRRQLPEELMRQLASEGMGGKAIATQLRKEHGVKVGFRTIYRILERS